jgi:hypothetical protein
MFNSIARPSLSRKGAPMPLRLSDAQLDEIFRLTKPLQPACRDAFLQILANELRGRSEVGDGELHRLMCAIIRDNHLVDYPDLTGGGSWSKYDGHR